MEKFEKTQEVKKCLAGVMFPLDKHSLVQYTKEYCDKVMSEVAKIEDRHYNSLEDVGHEVKREEMGEMIEKAAEEEKRIDEAEDAMEGLGR